VIIIG
jgi:hypothetical protein